MLRLSIPRRRILLRLFVGAFHMLPLTGRSAEVVDLQIGGSTFAACEIDLSRDRLTLHWKAETGQIYGSLRALDAWFRERGKKLVCGTNGGIFDESQKPLGLYIENGILLRRANFRRSGYGKNLRRALLLSRGDFSVLVTRPISLALLLAALALLFLIALPNIKRKREEVFVEETWQWHTHNPIDRSYPGRRRIAGSSYSSGSFAW